MAKGLCSKCYQSKLRNLRRKVIPGPYPCINTECGNTVSLKTSAHKGMCVPCYTKQYRDSNQDRLRPGRVRYRQENKEKRSENARLAYAADSVRARNIARDRTMQKFGSPHSYQTVLALQNGRCKICKDLPDTRSLSIDHCHATGKFRGLPCGRCNSALGSLRDSPDILQAAIQYLKDSQ